MITRQVVRPSLRRQVVFPSIYRQHPHTSQEQQAKQQGLRQHLSFSSQTARRNNDPATALQDALSLARTPRPENEPIRSRLPSESSDSENIALNNFPGSGSSIPPAPSSGRETTVANKTESLSNILRTSRPRPHRPRNVTGAPNHGIEFRLQRAIEAQSFRSFVEGDIIAPHDLSLAEHQKARFANSPNKKNQDLYSRSMGGKDVMEMLRINPLAEYKNFAMMSEYTTSMGRIKPRSQTGLKAATQRKLAKAIRRAQGIGLMPTVHKHPELMEDRLLERSQIGQYKSS